MPALRKSQQVLHGLRLIGNFLEMPIKVGDIVYWDDRQHLIWGNIANLVAGFTTRTGPKVDLKFTKESKIKVSIGGTVNSNIAEGQIRLTFDSNNSAFVSLKQSQSTTLDLAQINNSLKSYWALNGLINPINRNKYHLIVEVIEAESGTIIFSQDSGNEVIITGKNNKPLTSVAAACEGNVELVSNSKSTLELISETKIIPLYKAVKYKANGNFEIIG